MRIEVPARGLRPLSRLLTCMSRFSQEVHLAPLDEYLVLSTVNSSRSGFVRYTLHPMFFDSYEGSTREYGHRHLRIPIRPLLTVFKQAASKENVVSFTMTVENHQLVLLLQCKCQITKRYRLFVEEIDPMQAVYSTAESRNMWSILASTAMDWLVHFYGRVDEITMKCTPKHMFFSTYTETSAIESAPAATAGVNGRNGTASSLGANSLGTELRVNAIDFNKYIIDSLADENDDDDDNNDNGMARDHPNNNNDGTVKSLTVSFSLKEFKSILTFCAALNLNVNVHFDTPGAPVIVRVTQTNAFEADFVMSTMGYDDGVEIEKEASLVNNSTTTIGGAKSATAESPVKAANRTEHNYTLGSSPVSKVPHMDATKSNNVKSENGNDYDENEMAQDLGLDGFDNDNFGTQPSNHSQMSPSTKNKGVNHPMNPSYLTKYDEHNSSQMGTQQQDYTQNSLGHDPNDESRNPSQLPRRKFERTKTPKLNTHVDDNADNMDISRDDMDTSAVRNAVNNSTVYNASFVTLPDDEFESRTGVSVQPLPEFFADYEIKETVYPDDTRLYYADLLRAFI